MTPLQFLNRYFSKEDISFANGFSYIVVHAFGINNTTGRCYFGNLLNNKFSVENKLPTLAIIRGLLKITPYTSDYLEITKQIVAIIEANDSGKFSTLEGIQEFFYGKSYLYML